MPKESEETEVKKDIEWLKNEVNNLPLRFLGFSMLKQRDEFTVSKDDVLELINQLDEPEVEQLDRKIEELESYNDELIKDNKQLRDELDNQEVLSQKWLDKHSNGASRSQYVWLDDLKNLLVPKQELPVIPNYVAKWISIHHKQFDLYPALKRLENNALSWEDVYEWYRRNTYIFVNAYLTGKYEVEEEQKYRVVDNTDVHLLCKFEGEVITVAEFIEFSDISDVLKPEQYNLTEQEIKDYDPRYWAFRKPVEELEE